MGVADNRHTVILLTQRVETRVDETEVLGTGERSDAAGYFLFNFGHAYGALANVVGERSLADP